MKQFPEIKDTELFLCGGAVRDHLLGVKSNDRDFVAITKLSFDELVKAIEDAGGKVFLAKPEFLTIRCRFGKEVIDIVLPRSENNYTDGRHPDDVTRVETLEEDASRRDFTINAMYMDKNGDIFDFFKGRKHLLEDKIITAVGDPEERFKEDYLRIIRALRFAIKYNMHFGMLTQHAMIHNKEGLKTVSMERIKDEFNKALLINPYNTFEFIGKLELWNIIEHHGLWFELTNKKRPKG